MNMHWSRPRLWRSRYIVTARGNIWKSWKDAEEADVLHRCLENTAGFKQRAALRHFKDAYSSISGSYKSALKPDFVLVAPHMWSAALIVSTLQRKAHVFKLSVYINMTRIPQHLEVFCCFFYKRTHFLVSTLVPRRGVNTVISHLESMMNPVSLFAG